MAAGQGPRGLQTGPNLLANVTRTLSDSASARRANDLVESLQDRFRTGLEAVATKRGDPEPFGWTEWLRDGGRHGGGARYFKTWGPVFDRAAINISHVHYDDDLSRPLGSSSALSTIIHPRHPLAPSVHVHISWTERKDGTGYWRIMADLNPSQPREPDADLFADTLRRAAPEQFDGAAAQGDRYFHIPALGRHRGVRHFYLEGFATDDPDADLGLARAAGEAILDQYLDIVDRRLAGASDPSEEELKAQLDYHTVYFFQVLTLDRGTTSGLLVHDQNDVGIMGSLPSFVDRTLLASWRGKVPAAQAPLVDALVAELADTGEARTPVDDATRARLAAAVRAFYRAHPAALELQARGDVLPPTVTNHRGDRA